MKCLGAGLCAGVAASLPVRGAWVEILVEEPGERQRAVAPRAGSVG